MTFTLESFDLETKEINKIKENIAVITETNAYSNPQFFHTKEEPRDLSEIYVAIMKVDKDFMN